MLRKKIKGIDEIKDKGEFKDIDERKHIMKGADTGRYRRDWRSHHRLVL